MAEATSLSARIEEARQKEKALQEKIDTKEKEIEALKQALASKGLDELGQAEHAGLITEKKLLVSFSFEHAEATARLRELESQAKPEAGHELVIVTFVPNEEGNKKCTLQFKRGVTLQAFRDKFVSETPQYTYVQFGSNDDWIEDDEQLALFLGKSETIEMRYSTGQRKFSLWKDPAELAKYGIHEAKKRPEDNLLSEIGLAPLEDDGTEMKLFKEAIRELRKTSLAWGGANQGNEATNRVFINIVLTHVALCFAEVRVYAERGVQGSIGRGPLDYVLDYLQRYDILVTEAKKDDFVGGVAQNVAQLKVISEKMERTLKRKRPECDMYGIVTDGADWVFVKLNFDGKIFRKSRKVVVDISDPDSYFGLFRRLHWIVGHQIDAVNEKLDDEERPTQRARMDLDSDSSQPE